MLLAVCGATRRKQLLTVPAPPIPVRSVVAAAAPGVQAALQVRVRAELLDIEPPLFASGSFKPEVKSLLDQASKAVDDVFAKQARVHLLFAHESPTTFASIEVTQHLQKMMMALDRPPDSINNHAHLVFYSQNFSGAQEQHVKFNSAALAALQETWWDRLLERWHQRRRSKKES